MTDPLWSGVLRYCGMTPNIETTLRRLRRLANDYSRIQERWCNEAMDDATTRRLEMREARLEERMIELSEALPQPDDPSPERSGLGRWAIVFEGDPRGHTVALVPIWNGEDPVRVRRESSRHIGVDI